MRDLLVHLGLSISRCWLVPCLSTSSAAAKSRCPTMIPACSSGTKAHSGDHTRLSCHTPNTQPLKLSAEYGHPQALGCARYPTPTALTETSQDRKTQCWQYLQLIGQEIRRYVQPSVNHLDFSASMVHNVVK